MPQFFAHELRATLCPQCGAPTTVRDATPQCEYCGAELTVRSMGEHAPLVSRAEGMSESERIAGLRKQEKEDPEIPSDVAKFLVSGQLQAGREDAAMAEWQRNRQSLTATSAFAAQERLFFLTIALAERLHEKGESAKLRALLETSVDLCDDAKYRQALYCLLGREAVRVGEVEAAAKWIEGCDPRPTNIYMDSTYRYAAALVATASKKWSEVTALLGEKEDDVPLLDALEMPSFILRVNAVEQTGQAKEATEQLVQKIRGRGTLGTDKLMRAMGHQPTDSAKREEIERFLTEDNSSASSISLLEFEHEVAKLPTLNLCPESLPAARDAALPLLDAREFNRRFFESSGLKLNPFLTPLSAITAFMSTGFTLALKDGNAAEVMASKFVAAFALLPWYYLIVKVFLPRFLRRRRVKKLLRNPIRQTAKVESCSYDASPWGHSSSVELTVEHPTEGTLTVDLPAEVSRETQQRLRRLGIAPVLIDANTPPVVLLER